MGVTKRPPILLEVDGVTLAGGFVWTRDNRDHAKCHFCQAEPSKPCFVDQRIEYSDGWSVGSSAIIDEPFVHVGRR